MTAPITIHLEDAELEELADASRETGQPIHAIVTQIFRAGRASLPGVAGGEDVPVTPPTPQYGLESDPPEHPLSRIPVMGKRRR